MITDKILIVCQPRTGSSILTSYLADCLSAKAIYNLDEIYLPSFNGPIVVKMEDTFSDNMIKKIYPTIDLSDWTVIILKRKNILEQILSTCQRLYHFGNYVDNYYITRESFFLSAYTILQCTIIINRFDSSEFKYVHEIMFEDMQTDWESIVEKLGTPFKDYLNNRPLTDKWKYVINKDEVFKWIEELKIHYIL